MSLRPGMRGRLAALLVAASAVVPALVLAAPATAASTTLTATPIADTYVNSGAPGTNYGASASLSSRGTPAAESYLRFSIPAAPAGTVLSAARLVLRTTSDPTASSVDSHLISLASDAWTDTAVTWSTRPAWDGAALGVLGQAPDLNTTYAVTLDADALRPVLGAQATFALSSSGGDGLYVWSSNYASAAGRPQLQLTFVEDQQNGQAGPATPAPTTTPSTTSGAPGAGGGASPSGTSPAASTTPATTSTSSSPQETTLPPSRTVTVGPLADTYANAGAPSVNFGTSGSLASRGQPGAVSYLRFAVPAPPEGSVLTGARLVVRTTADAPATSVDTHLVGTAPDTWDEATLTWNARPPVDGVVLGTLSGLSALSTTYAAVLDPALVTPLLGRQSTLTLTSLGSDSVYLCSSNSPVAAARPQLELTFTAATTTSTTTSSTSTTTTSTSTTTSSTSTTTTSPATTSTSTTTPPTTSTSGPTTSSPTSTTSPTTPPPAVDARAVDALVPVAAPTITWWGGTTSSLAKSARVAPDDDRLGYRGATGFAYGTGTDAGVYAPNSRYPHTWNAQSVWSLDFVTDAAAIELGYVQRTESWYRVVINGHVVTEEPKRLPMAVLNSPGLLKLDFGSSKQRRITLELQSVRFTGLNLPGGAALRWPAPYAVRWAVLGDSISGGSNMSSGNGQGTWVTRAARLLGWDEPFNESSGGSGYVSAGQSVKFGDRLADDVIAADPQKVVLFGGYNDAMQSQDAVRAEAASVLARLRDGLPEAQVYVVGCWSPRGTPVKGWVETNATLEQVARDAHVPFVSVLDGKLFDAAGTLVASTGPWITGSGTVASPNGTGTADRYIGSDGVHPTDLGHAYLGRRMAEALAILTPGEYFAGNTFLTWKPVSGATSYAVHRSTDPAFTPSAATQIAEVGTPEFTDTPPVPGRYQYAVVPLAGGQPLGAPLLSGPAAFPGGPSRVLTDVVAPTAPSSLKAGARTASGKVSLTWSASSDDVTRVLYEVHRWTTADFTPSASTLIGYTSATAFADVRPPDGAVAYKVVAVDGADNVSAASSAATPGG